MTTNHKQPARLSEDPLHGFDSSTPYNTGILICGDALSSEAERTLVVSGAPRSGTTAIAACLAMMGVPMGVPVPPPVHEYNYEDPAFIQMLHMETPRDIDLHGLRDLISQRNGTHAVWGFKLPMALHSLPVLQRELRNPAFVFAFRDPVAVSCREMIATGADAVSAIYRALGWQRVIVEFIASSGAPCLVISYEKALQFPKSLVKTLSRWAGLTCDETVLGRAAAIIAANNGDYLQGVRFQCDYFGVPVPPKA